MHLPIEGAGATGAQSDCIMQALDNEHRGAEAFENADVHFHLWG